MFNRKLRVLYEKHCRYMFNMKQDKDGVAQGSQNVAPPYKEKNTEGVDSEEDSADDFDHETECSQLDEVC